MHLVMCVFSCVFMWVWVPCNFYQRDQLLTGRAKVSSWPSHHALSVGSLECAGMWVRTGGEVLLRDRHPDTTPPPSLHQLVFPPQHYSLSLKFPLVLRLKNECQETAPCFFSLYMVSGEEMEADKLERKGWFNARTRVQAFPFIFFLLAIFFLCLIDGVWTPLSAHTERYSHSAADGLSGCFRPLVPSSGSLNLPQQEVRCSKVFSPG